jgi:hypothetical protein
MINKVFTYIASFPHDKAMHMLTGVILYAACTHIVGAVIAFLIVACAAIAKEVYDLMHTETNTPDIYDALATIAGGALGYIIQL